MDLVARFVAALLAHDVPRQRVEDYGNDIVRLVRELAATPSTPGLDVEHPIDPWTLARVRNTLDDVLARLPAPPKATDDAIAYRDGWLDGIRAVRNELADAVLTSTEGAPK